MELDKNCNKHAPSLAAGLSGLLFTKLGNLTTDVLTYSLYQNIQNIGK